MPRSSQHPDTRTGAPRPPSRAAIEEMLELATRAPSIQNTQPWLWRWNGRRLTLLADRGRHLVTADPGGRELVISCGAALHHLQVAAEGLGWRATVSRVVPQPGEDALAVVGFTPAAGGPGQQVMLRAIAARHTDRRRGRSYPVPAARVEELVAEGCSWGVQVVADDGLNALFARLTQEADARQQSDADYLRELKTLEDGPGTGLRPPPTADPEVERILLFATSSDDQLSWLRVGEALSATWLSAVQHGLYLVPLSQALEVGTTRSAVTGLLDDRACPQLLARVGWPQEAPDEEPRSTRRPVSEVLQVNEAVDA